MFDRQSYRLVRAFTLFGLAVALLAACARLPSLPVPAGMQETLAAAPSQLSGVSSTLQAGGQTAQAMAGTAAADLPGKATALAGTVQAGATELAPTAQALATKAAGAVTAIASLTPPRLTGQAEAGAVIEQYAGEVLGRQVTIVAAGGLSADIQRLIRLPGAADRAHDAAAGAAAQTYGALLQGGAGSVSYGSGSLTGDISVDLNSASLGAFSFDAGPMPASEAEALTLALQTYPGLADRSFKPYALPEGYAWTAQGQVPGFEPGTRQATLVSEEILLAIIPAGTGHTAASVAVGKGAFAADVIP